MTGGNVFFIFPPVQLLRVIAVATVDKMEPVFVCRKATCLDI